MTIPALPGLQIESPLVDPKNLNFRPDSWPPKADFPVTLNEQGETVSMYGDVKWDLSPWTNQTLTMHFGDGPGQGKKISPENAALLRQITGWWLWGEAAIRSAKALVYKFETIKPLFVACTDNGILVTELNKYPMVIKGLKNYYNARADRLINCLDSLNIAKSSLGFSILDKHGLLTLIETLPSFESIQTAYIPPRIWTYQVLRLRKCLDDFIAHQQQIEACYTFSLEAFANNANGQLSEAFGGLGLDSPFRNARSIGPRKSGKVFYGSFRETAKKFGIEKLLDRWVKTDKQTGISSLSSYLSLISSAGLAYTLNFSLMRVDEGARLRAKCHEIERDPNGDDIHLLKGVTTKTIEDDDARWIVSPSVKIAIDVMTVVAKLRLKAGIHNSKLTLSEHDIENPILQSIAHEPWSPKASAPQSTKKFKKIRSYRDIWNLWPKLFEFKELTITVSDLEMANRLTFGLDANKFSVGKPWPIAWHQLRRTGAVNMLASGLVTEASLQYQLKHASRAMSQYYGKNYYRLKDPLNEETRNFYIREMYLAMLREFKALQSEQYISPHGEKRKIQIISEISAKDHNSLIDAAKSGALSYRDTFLGGCTNTGPPCTLGGISNISSCMGFGDSKPCKSVILDMEKLPIIKQLTEVIRGQIKSAETGSIQHESLQSQLESAERAIHVIEKR